MRPLSGDDAFAASSRPPSFSDNDATPLAPRGHTPQMTCFFADEKSIGESVPSPFLRPKQRDPKDSTYGVESLETTISSLSASHEDPEPRRGTRRHRKRHSGQGMSKADEDEADLTDVPSTDVSGRASPFHTRRASQTTISRPFTPLSLGSPAPPSLLSSAGSRRNSDACSFEDDAASQAIISSGDEERDMESTMMDSGSAPQLVMPSIKMPSRRPFTERGKNMGRLKILIAGDSGVGKTSLIKAIVQTCEDIVHVDPLSATTVAIPERRNSKSKSRSGSAGSIATTEVTEIYASTRAYPSWWSDLEESRVLRRRKSWGDSVLERNLCFVDTPGYGNKTSCLEAIVPVVDYIESHFKKVASLQDMSDSETISLLSGNGGTQVDLVFYVFAQRVKPVDVEYLRRLSRLTNVVPLISRSDLLSGQELALLKENIMSAFQTNSVKPFSFDQLFNGSSRPDAPYAISSTASKDDETMDASLLMSPDYVQPLLESELPYLVSHIFERDTASWLRHSAAKKFVQWRSSSCSPATSPPQDRPLSLYRPLSQHQHRRQLSSVLAGTTAATSGSTSGTTSYALARISDHTQREERIAQVRLANWAADLQRSLANERRRFDQLARSDRAVWLTERLGECVQDGTIVPVSVSRPSRPASTYDIYDVNGVLVEKQETYSRKKRRDGSSSGVDPHDPLGLLRLNADVRRKGWVALQLVSSLGVLGGLAYYMTRSWQVAESESVGVWQWILEAL